MMKKNIEWKIAATALLIVATLSFSIYFIFYNQYYGMVIEGLKNDAVVVHEYAEAAIRKESFLELNTKEDEEKDVYQETHALLDKIKRIANVAFLYTVKKTEDGRYIYVVDGLSPDDEDFSHIGDEVEEDFIPFLNRVYKDETVFGNNILNTEWGALYVAYFPFHDADGNIVGAINLEFDCNNLYYTLNRTMYATLLATFIVSIIAVVFSYVFIRNVIKSSKKIFERMEKEKVKLKEKAQKIYYDALTGIYNRRYLDENLDRLIKSLSRADGILSIMMIDIDRFKTYNDTYGHVEGDNCLNIIAKALSECITRKSDFVVRYGGEEFVVVLPNTDENGARLIAEKLLENIRNLEIPNVNCDVLPKITLSVGCVTGKADHTRSCKDYIRMADEALYASKQGGRNRYTQISCDNI